MAGPATDPSRMGITLQGYDQVIALSQANINETLRRHFSTLDARGDLGTFKAKAGSASISAEVGAPTIELIDKENADGALYVIPLGEGTFTSVETVGEGDDVDFKIVKIPTNGWELAFDVNFAFKPVDKDKIPGHIVRQVPLPGGYSVHQLMVNFGDMARILPIDPDKSKFPIKAELQDKITPEALKASMEVFLRTYVKTKLAQKEDHNILGFAVKLEEAPANGKATFVPAESKVQIIGHRADGKAGTFRQDNPYNAFCFTEMCYTEANTRQQMPSSEIKYSGNWFYQSFGGTLAMSRRLFWGSFMVQKIQDAHVKAVEISSSILNVVASDNFKGKSWCIDESKPSPSQMCGSYKGNESWGDLAYTATYKSSELQHWNKNASVLVNFWSCPRSTVHTLAKPSPRKGEIQIQQDIQISWKEGAELPDNFNFNPLMALATKAFNASISGSLTLKITSTISFASVTSSGELKVNLNTATPHKDYKELEIRIGGLVGSALPDNVQKLVNKWSEELSDNYKKGKSTFDSEVQKLGGHFSNVATALKEDLNKQNKFIFPGNGTFDMKDPIFNDRGDLMIGLTYR